MNTSYILVIICVWLALCIYYLRKNTEILQHIKKKKNSVERLKMVELAKKFIGVFEYSSILFINTNRYRKSYSTVS